jgi:hypothetical protein
VSVSSNPTNNAVEACLCDALKEGPCLCFTQGERTATAVELEQPTKCGACGAEWTRDGHVLAKLERTSDRTSSEQRSHEPEQPSITPVCSWGLSCEASVSRRMDDGRELCEYHAGLAGGMKVAQARIERIIESGVPLGDLFPKRDKRGEWINRPALLAAIRGGDDAPNPESHRCRGDIKCHDCTERWGDDA